MLGYPPCSAIGQLRPDGIPCPSPAIDEVLKTPIYFSYGKQPSIMLLRGFFESRIYPMYAGAWQLIRCTPSHNECSEVYRAMSLYHLFNRGNLTVSTTGSCSFICQLTRRRDPPPAGSPRTL
ncbi:hypothetical protein EVAR_12455_1 [Eumeta japonica]|uniref:Uncharacterized protein n=1 Tax=Eumeta variegata TaxID=151549 RepID=A0A4C1TPH2_EUMVA|nr:hypothetical protein EVAR_12455_1 [Eumeta japonica]